MKMMTPELRSKIDAEIKMMLHASRDCMRNQYKAGLRAGNNPKNDPVITRYNINDGYYGEAFGILRTLAILGYGSLTTTRNFTFNLRQWFVELENQVLQEENFGGNGQCDYCLEHYGKDDAGRTRVENPVG